MSSHRPHLLHFMPKGENNRKLSDAQRNEIVERYTTPSPSGRPVGAPTLARDYGVTVQTIYYVLRRSGVQTRDARDAQFGRPKIDRGTAPLCKCGCGTSVVWSRSKRRWNLFADGHYRADALYKNRKWLVEQYVTKGRTVDEIASDFGVAGTTITKAMRRHGIERRSRSAARIGRQAGAKNPAWKGGVTPERQRLYKTQEWRTLIKACFARDGYKCQRCGTAKTRAIEFHAHHVKTWADHPELRMDVGNLVTLCDGCHLWVHSKRNVLRDFLI